MTDNLKNIIWKWFKFRHQGDRELLDLYRLLFDMDDGISLLEHQARTLEETLDLIEEELTLWLEEIKDEEN